MGTSAPGKLNFEDRVVVVTGGGNGIGRAHSEVFAELGASVVVNDFGTTVTGEAAFEPAASQVTETIVARGGVAVANSDSVEEGHRIIECALDHFGRIDVLVNNAGILRDGAFHNMTDEDWDAVYNVHVLGSYQCTKAAWPHFRNQKYGRVVFTVSGSGIYGNFGQTNYAMAKSGTAGLAQSLAIEGRSRNIRVNSIAPVAGSRLPADIWPQEVLEAMNPRYVSHAVAYLCHESSTQTGGIFEVGGGCISRLRWHRSKSVAFPVDDSWSIDDVASCIDQINDFSQGDYPDSIVDAFKPVLDNLPEAVAAAWREKTGDLWDSSNKSAD